MSYRLSTILFVAVGLCITSNSAEAPPKPKIDELLLRKCKFPTEQTTLRKQLRSIGAQTKTEIHLTKEAKERKGLGIDTPVEVQSFDNEMELFECLPIILSTYFLTYTVEKGEVVIRPMPKQENVWINAYHQKPGDLFRKLAKPLPKDLEGGGEMPRSDLIEYLRDYSKADIRVYRIKPDPGGYEPLRSNVIILDFEPGATVQDGLAHLLSKMNSFGVIHDDRIYLVLNDS